MSGTVRSLMTVTASRLLMICSVHSVISSVTLTPLIGFLVGDRRPSLTASGIVLGFAAIFAIAAYVIGEAVRFHRRRVRARLILRTAIEVAANRNPADRFASARSLAHDAGLPWIEPDGTITRGDQL